ncbi:MAG: Crp/Fnr family transcriptional regulator [Bacteroidetes bacterium]|nr:Crp/Fnr family transcriptional regulator [Bacteroidota bacterium]
MTEFQKFSDWLKDVPFMSEEDGLFFEPFLKKKIIKEKEIILSEGNICKEVGFVNYGGFRIYYLSEGKEINTKFIFENQFITDYNSFLQEKPSKYFIEALEKSEIVTFNLSVLQNAYNHSHNWERFGRLMAEQLYKMITQRAESFLFLDGEQRYLQILENEPHLLNRVPLYHIASYIGLEKESLSRLRKKIAQK